MHTSLHKSVKQLVLASASPRRRQILEQGGYEFHNASVKVSEIVKENLNLEAQIEELAWQKAQALVECDKSLKKQGNLILSADTVVVLDGRILGKPQTSLEAREILGDLSDKKHQVITGVCLWEVSLDQKVFFHEVSEVEFRSLSQNEIDEYIATGDCMDKAGAYGIQGPAKKFVAAKRGSYLNIVGLPLEKLEQVLAQNRWQINKKNSLQRSFLQVLQSIQRANGIEDSIQKVTLLAVSKKQSPEKIREIRSYGQMDFAENYVQELLQKQFEVFDEEIRWHFIGALQRNKVKLIVGRVDTIQSVDRLELLEEIQKVASHKNIVQKVLLQVNLAGESSKSGCRREDLPKLVAKACELKNIHLCGLMALPPLTNSREEQCENFRKLKEELVKVQKDYGADINQLSMGTTGDFLEAIKNGSTMVRVGTAIFGERLK